MLRHRSRLPLKVLLALLFFLNPAEARARSVVIEWKPMKHAVSYELEIEKNGKTKVVEQTKTSQWRGELPYGFHSFRVRAHDKFQRAGNWSASSPLVVMPVSPKPLLPRPGATVHLYNPAVPIQLKWTSTEGASAYEVELKRDGKVVASKMVTDPEATLQLPAGWTGGDYEWQVSAIVAPTTRGPASYSNRTWRSPPSSAEELTIEQRLLEKPRQVAPLGTVAPASDSRLKLKWKSVDGAEAYELRVWGKARKPAGDFEQKLTTTETSAEVKAPQEGVFRWEVKALANISDAKAGATGPSSVADFKLDPKANFVEGSGYIALSTMLAPYSYNISSPLTNKEASFNSVSTTVRLSGEYWFNQSYGGAVGLGNTNFSIRGRGISRIDLELLAKYRFLIGPAKSGWVIIPKAGLEYRDYPEVRVYDYNGSTDFYVNKASTVGPAIGLDFRKQFNQRFSLGGKLGYFKPLVLSTQVGGELTGNYNDRNLSLGLQGLYWLGGRWGAGAGVHYEMRSLSYSTLAGQEGNYSQPAGKLQRIKMDGAYFFGSIIYSLGK